MLLGPLARMNGKLLPVVASSLFLALPARSAEPPLRCTTGPHSGTFDGEAETATQLTCDELRRVGGTGDYEVTVSRLGTAIFLSVRDASGDVRRLQIGSLEEVPVAAPRVAEALVRHLSVQSTQQVDNVVEQETRTYRKQNGEALAGVGIGGMHLPRAEQFAMPAFNLRGAYETLDFAAVADLRVGGSTDDGGQSASAFSLGGGGRYFFSRADLTPFVGGGISYTALAYKDDWQGEVKGLGVYAEAGIEALRTHKGRLAFDVRLEAPFYTLKLTRYSSSAEMTESRSLYAMPITFALAYSYRGI